MPYNHPIEKTPRTWRRAMRRLLLVYILFVVAFAGCGSSSPATVTPMLTLTATPNISATNTAIAASKTATSVANATRTRQRQIDALNQSENEWNAQHISTYRLIVRFQTAFGAPPMFTVETTVMNGSVANVVISCSPSCAFNTSYDVPTLFRGARQIINDPNCISTVTYDKQYGFPTVAECQSAPNVTDNQHTISVSLFTVLP